MRCAESGSGYLRISSLSPRSSRTGANAVAGEQVPDALLSLGVLAPINECQGDPYPPAEPYMSFPILQSAWTF